MSRVAVIGGGAAGLMAAVTAASMGDSVTVYEAGDSPARKILATGNGRCNFSNEVLDSGCYYGGEPKRRSTVLNRFSNIDTQAFFRSLGMRVRSRNGYLYPATNEARTVRDLLLQKAAGLHVIFRVSESVSDIRSLNGFDRAIIATGGGNVNLARALGHSTVPMVPALCPLVCAETKWLRLIAGVRAMAGLILYVDGEAQALEYGEVQFTDYGISGIAVFQLSRIAAYALTDGSRVEMELRLIEDEDGLKMLTDRVSQQNTQAHPVADGPSVLTDRVSQHNAQMQTKCVEQTTLTDRVSQQNTQPLLGLVHSKLAGLFLRMSGGDVALAASYCRAWKLTVIGVRKELAQVTAGGVPLSEVSDELESVYCPGVYLAGEVLDVDGKCGGYNLQWAWSSGHVAGGARGCMEE